jgi:hypothetical protein
LKRFLFIKLGEAEDQQCQLFEPKGRVLALPGASLRFIKKRFRTREKGFGQQTLMDGQDNNQTATSEGLLRPFGNGKFAYRFFVNLITLSHAAA